MSFGVFCHFQAQNGVFLVVFDFWQIIPYFCFIFEESCPFSYKIFPAGHYFLHFNQYLVFCSSFFGCFSIKSLSFETMLYWLYSLFDAWRFWGLLSLEKGVLKKSIWSHWRASETFTPSRRSRPSWPSFLSSSLPLASPGGTGGTTYQIDWSVEHLWVLRGALGGRTPNTFVSTFFYKCCFFLWPFWNSLTNSNI